ncbi:hypothetical protein IMSAGC020_02209 [Lachnospiraceae bacterium]|nr:hypothetical protein IMSAGC020_02209 [Lachnospiraceae bacterium]
MLVSCFLKRSSDESDIVGSTASAAGLADDHGDLAGIIPPGQDGVHDLSHHHQRRIAGVVVDIFKSHVHGLLVVVRQDLDVVSGRFKGRLQQIEMDRRHLRAEDGVILAHLFGKRNLRDGRGVDCPLLVPFLPYPDGRKQGAYPDPCRS